MVGRQLAHSDKGLGCHSSQVSSLPQGTLGETRGYRLCALCWLQQSLVRKSQMSMGHQSLTAYPKNADSCPLFKSQLRLKRGRNQAPDFDKHSSDSDESEPQICLEKSWLNSSSRYRQILFRQTLKTGGFNELFCRTEEPSLFQSVGTNGQNL